MEKGVIVDPGYWSFDYGRHHPLRTFRVKLAYELMKSYNVLFGEIKPHPATEEDLLIFHDQNYIAALKEEKPFPELGLGTEENPVGKGLFEFCLLTVGGTLEALRKALQGGRFFNIGGGMHHAQRKKASGFCYVNDIVIALKKALESINRIFYLDLDAHHCDAVQQEFYETDKVLVVSVHQEGIFPETGRPEETGEGPGKGFNYNIPLPRYAEDEDVWYAFEKLILPLLERYEPELLFIQLGADAHKDDPLTSLYLTTGIYEKIAKTLSELKIPVLITGGGGYDIVNVARVWTLFWAALNGIELLDQLPDWFLRISIMEGYDGPGIRDIPGWSGNKHQVKESIKEVVSFLRRQSPIL